MAASVFLRSFWMLWEKITIAICSLVKSVWNQDEKSNTSVSALAGPEKITIHKALSHLCHLQMFFKVSVLKNFVISTGKHLCWSLLAFRPATLWKSVLFSCQYGEIFKNTFFYRTPPVAASIKGQSALVNWILNTKTYARVVFRIPSNIHDGTFFRKFLTAFSSSLFSQAKLRHRCLTGF